MLQRPFLRLVHRNNAISHRSLSTNGNMIGVIGLGNMGLSMAKNVLNNAQTGQKHGVVVYDINREAVKSMEALGAKGAANVAELAKQCSTIITMLPMTSHVQATLLGEHGVFQNCPKGSLIIDSSTIDPIASQGLHKEAVNRGLFMLDAPVSGGVTGAAAGTLTFMVGGTEEVLEKGRPVLQAMGKNIIHCGDAGAGGVTKLCNNLALAISMVGTSEAMSLGMRMGLDPKKLAGVMNTSTGRCWSSDSYNPVPGLMPNVPSSNGYKGGFGAALMEKDLTLAMEMASKIKARLALGAQAHQLYGLLCEHDYGNKDFSVIFDFIMHSQKQPKA